MQPWLPLTYGVSPTAEDEVLLTAANGLTLAVEVGVLVQPYLRMATACCGDYFMESSFSTLYCRSCGQRTELPAGLSDTYPELLESLGTTRLGLWCDAYCESPLQGTLMAADLAEASARVRNLLFHDGSARSVVEVLRKEFHE